jgi:nitrogen regulatory protein PII 2
MKQIIAIIRDERVEETKKALEETGIRGVTFLYATGRGQQKGTVRVREPRSIMDRPLPVQLNDTVDAGGFPDYPKEMPGYSFPPEKEFAFGFLPKRMLVLIANDEEIESIVRAIVNANQTGRHGDGRIFICPMISAIRVRTGEQGNEALT